MKSCAIAPARVTRMAAWSGYAMLLLLAPLVFDSGLGQSLLAQTGIAIIACLSYNLLLGEGGMLSFGHAVYSGFGAYLAMHTLNRVAAGLPLPVSLIPLVGGVAAMALALVLGWVTTKKAAMPFAMITFGMGELVWAAALVFTGFFGGEAGVSGNRVVGSAWAGISFGPPMQLNYLIAAYTLICTVLLYALTRTPLGRMFNAVRDNPERVAFVGYNPQRLRYHAFVIAAFFAGIAGGLAALNFEMVTPEVFSAQRSGAYLLFTVLGGVGFFWGPIVGALLMVLSFVLLASITPAWLLYVGLAFILTVMYAPGGVAALLVRLWQLLRGGGLRRLWRVYLAVLAAALLALGGLAALVELLYRWQQLAVLGPDLPFFWGTLNVHHPAHWLAAAAVMLGGLALLTQSSRWLTKRLAADLSLGQDVAWPEAAWAAGVQASAAAEVPAHGPGPGQHRQMPALAPTRQLVTEVAPAPASVVLNASRSPEPCLGGHDGAANPCDTALGLMSLALAPMAMGAKDTLVLRDVCQRFGQTDVIRGLSLTVQCGERIGIIGPNGAGKSTLFDLISGRCAPSRGQVLLGELRIDGKKPFQINRLGLSRSFQVSSLFASLSVLDNLRCALLWQLGYRYTLLKRLAKLPDVNARAEELMQQLQLQNQRDTPAARLSYAAQRALELGITLASGAKVILLDEPTAGMSQTESANFVALIAAVTVGKTLLIIEHDMPVLFGLASKIAVISDGRLLAFDTPDAVRANPQVQLAYLGKVAAGE